MAVRHNDPNASSSAIAIVVTVTDSLGASAEKVLTLVVSSSPALDVAPVVVVAGAGEKATVHINDHVTGGSGAYRVLDAVASGASSNGLLVVPNAAAGTVELTAPTPGEYAVTYSVQDATTLAEQSAVIRLTVPQAGVPISIAPVTAFVRANEDTTIDLLGAVQNSTGRVLIVSQATTSDPGLSVSVVGQAQVRVSGSTPSGAPGKVGTATVTITDSATSLVEGQLTVFQVPESTDSFPIVVPDSVTVRAGGQVDIPVLANDLSPRGERLVLHPVITGSGTTGELAFVSGDAVRYLAPTVPGVYTLRYSVYLESHPDRVETATISATVLPSGANRAPQPSILTARALAGQTVQIPVAGFGVDPDGDRVVLAAVVQPSAGRGVAAISAEGNAIVYTAPAAGVPDGQVSFEYSVRDAEGAEGTALVRVGVLSDALSDSTPITYSDYVRTTTTATNPITVDPILNDRDPSQGSLAIISLAPNAPVGTEEFARLDALIDPATSLESGTVVLNSGSVLGTHSYVYTVQSSISTSTAEGLIVVNVSDVAAPDYPEITDTVVTARSRLEFASTGLDVVKGKVQWPSGDVSSLTLSIWSGAPAGFTVSGTTIKGTLPAKGALVPFSLTGTDSAGGEVVSYGFLRIPAFDDMRVQLKPTADPIEVNEEKSVEFTLRDLLDLDRTDAVEIRADDAFTVQRTNASCAPSGASKAVYNTGREAPWVDSCTVPVRIVGQTNWTMVSVPIDIIPKDPQAILNSVTRTISPGASESIDIYKNMTTWEGGREGDIAKLIYSISPAGTAFIVTKTGNKVSIDTRADALPGTRSTIQVSTDAYGGLSAAITLIVGVAAPDAPRGANFTQQCDVSRGGSCPIPVTGVSGEYDPFAGKVGSGLKVVSVGTGSPVSCAVATVSVSSATQVVATWPTGPKPVGGECVVPFTVADAQGRTGTGQLTIDVLGYPQTPASVTTASYTGDSVTLYIALGTATQAHPSVTGAALFEGGVQVAPCLASPPSGYSCVISGLENGAIHNYTAQAINSVGNSSDTTPVKTNAYKAPKITSLSASPIYDPAQTTDTIGRVDLTISASSDSASFRVNGQVLTNDGLVKHLTMPVGSQSIDVIPISQFAPPISGSNEGATTSTTVLVAGRGYFPPGGSVVVSGDGTTATMSVPAFNANSSALGTDILYTASQGGPVTCTGNGTASYSGGSSVVTSATSTLTGLAKLQTYYFVACGTNGYGIDPSDTVTAITWEDPGNPPPSSYTISDSPTTNDNVVRWGLESGPSVPGRPGYQTKYNMYGGIQNTFSLNDNVSPGTVTAVYCFLGMCNGGTTVSYLGAPTTVTITFPESCPALPDGSDVPIPAGVAATGGYDAIDRQYFVTFSGQFALTKYQYTGLTCPAPIP